MAVEWLQAIIGILPVRRQECFAPLSMNGQCANGLHVCHKCLLYVNLTTNSAIITKTLFAGNPKGMNAIAFPGQSRIISVTSVEDLGGAYRIRGMVNDRSLLQRGESATFDIVVNPAQRTARTSLAGSELVMNLEP